MDDIDLGEFQTGDTIRLQATFKNFAGTLANLTVAPTLKIYDENKVLLTTIASGSLTNASTGVYYYDYLIPATDGIYYIEFAGTVDSSVVLRRGYFYAGFV
jgi:hypothetical protein